MRTGDSVGGEPGLSGIDRQTSGAPYRSASDEQLRNLLDMLGLGVIVFSEMRATYANHQAKDILAQNDGLSLDSGLRLRAMKQDEDKALQSLLRLTHCVAGDGGSKPSNNVAISRSTAGHFYPITITKLRREMLGDDFPLGSVAVFIRDTKNSGSIGWDAIGRALMLTKTEVRLAKHIVDGHSAEEAAREMRISVSTVRWHLKQIFEKTGTKRQAELVRLILGMAMPLRL